MTPLGIDAGILAAGEGRRFQDAGVGLPKPLIPVAGKPLIGWVLQGFVEAGLSTVAVLVSRRNEGAKLYGERAYPDLKLRWLVQDTGSTLESFCVVTKALKGSRFVVSTADALCRPKESARFVKAAKAKRHDIVLGVTRHRVDKTSLRVKVDRRGLAREIVKGGSGPVATSGIYFFGPGVRAAARKELAAGAPSLSSFLGRCPGLGFKVGVVEMKEVFDVDKPEDARAAERALLKA